MTNVTIGNDRYSPSGAYPGEGERIIKEKMEKISFTTDDGVEEFYVLDETRISNRNYILVSESLEDEAEVMIFKDVSAETDTEAVYVPVDDVVELDAVASVFSESLGDIDIE